MKLLITLIAGLAMQGAFGMAFNSIEQTVETYISSIGQMALDIDSILSEGTKNNVVISPLNLGSMLLTLLAASNGQTHKELEHLLKFDRLDSNVDYHGEVFHRILGYLHSRSYTSVGPDMPQTNQATGVFMKNGFHINEKFENIIKNAYNSVVMNLDFQNDNQQAQRVINNWANDATRGKIPSMLSAPPLPDTELIIASALYFSGAWKNMFPESLTRREKFFVEKDESYDIDMMLNSGDFPYYSDRNLGAHIIGLPYKGSQSSDISMYVLQPYNENSGAASLNALKQKLNISVVNDLIEKMTVQECIIGLPKMSMSSSVNLKDAFSALGLRSLFEAGKADLTYLAPQNKGLYASIMSHNVKIIINEKGTEAAATTYISASRRALARVVANRPFVFFIRDNNTKLIWFWATVNQANSN